MTRRPRQPIHPSRSFTSPEEEVAIEVQRAATAITRGVAEALRPSGLTPAQFNVLRILRGARPAALCAKVIADRMITHDPDLTRLIDRLEAAGWVEKIRDTADRRMVNIHVTPAGVSRVEAATLAVRQRLELTMRPLGPARLQSLAGLLETLRASGATESNTAAADVSKTSHVHPKQVLPKSNRPKIGKKP